MSDTPRTDQFDLPAYGEEALQCLRAEARDMERELAAVTADRDTLLAVVNTLADKRWFLDNVGAECTFEGSQMVQIGHLEDLVEMAENALRGKAAA